MEYNKTQDTTTRGVREAGVRGGGGRPGAASPPPVTLLTAKGHPLNINRFRA